jgi:CheY-like chemotaxis protein/signal transduction histidine kinase
MDEKSDRVPLGKTSPSSGLKKPGSLSETLSFAPPPRRGVLEQRRSLASTLISSQDLEPKEFGVLSLLQNRILECCALGAPTQESMDSLCFLVEEMVPGSVVSLLLYDPEEGKLQWGAGPNLPLSLKKLLSGLPVVFGMGSCPSAILSEKECFVEDTLEDERWGKVRHIAEQFGLRSCWSLPITDGEGDFFGTFAITLDRTGMPSAFQQQLLGTARYLAAVILMRDRWEKERCDLAHALQNRKRLESLGRLTGGIAHDFNNILTTLLAYCDLLKSKAQEDGSFVPGSLDDLCEIEHAGLRGAEIARKLLLFCQEKPFDQVVFSPNRVIEDLCLMLRRVLREDLELNLNLSQPGMQVRSDEADFGQSILYLILNVRDQLSKGGRVQIETRMDLHSEGEDGIGGEEGTFRLLISGTQPEGLPFLKTEIQDDGLSTVEGFAKRAGGRLKGILHKDGGPCWEMILPATQIPNPLNPQDTPADLSRELKGNGKTILVCEDEPSIRTLLERLLEEHGFEVLLAPDAEWAEKLFLEDPEKIDLLLTDLVLPRKNGFELACRLRALNKELPVIIVTGYSQEVVPPKPEGLDFPILKKPFRAETLLQAIGKLILL